MELNKQQQEAVDHVDGPCLVTSAPGSGKTRIISGRVVKLIQKGINPSNILCLTFTNKAANEMKSRIIKMLSVEQLDVHVSTFHSFCVKILRLHADKIGRNRNFSIINESDQQLVIKQIGKQLGFTKKDQFDTYNIVKQLNFGRENMENDIQLASRFHDPVEWKIASCYVDELKKHNLIDFSGLLRETVDILEKDEEVLETLRNRYKYVQIDESQDTNYIQFHLVNLIGALHHNILVCADIDQSIYKFRNARYENIDDFVKLHTGCKHILLSKNYRSTPQILKVADNLIKHNSNHGIGEMQTDNPDGPPVRYKRFETPELEANEVAVRTKYYIEELGYDGSDIAVFYRLNRLSIDLQTAFRKFNIPFKVVGGPSFFDRREIRDSIAILRFLANPKDTPAFHRIIDSIKGVGDTTFHKLHTLSQEHNKDFLWTCRNINNFDSSTSVEKAASKISDIFDIGSATLSVSFDSIFNKMEYLQTLENKAKSDKEYLERKDNIDTFVADAISSTSNDVDNLTDYLNTISLLSSEDDKDDKELVTLQSMHSAKGLEYTVTFLVGIEQKIIPHYLAIQEAKNDEEKIENLSEERRVFYVAITRSEKFLFLSSCDKRKIRTKQGISYIYSLPSQFIKEAGL